MINVKIKAVADRHVAARKANKFDNPVVRNRREVVIALYGGKTFENILDQIEITHCNVFAVFLANHLGIFTIWYKIGVYNGFEKLLVNSKKYYNEVRTTHG